ncbi:helix-turn-helix domain-containing protein [Pedobacter nyackensis]|uniref:Helix-turn-helix n=1 Tax=Pedobacter nyackensis TaxID=475255 RepID=A0A1W1ZXG5_9SPHI|nr:helix-turn-helix transcriptional regulator [Pedobacter nyackensis]SMC52758.1 Helix-turn-helix [Pedobacter nyackensis]
MGVDSYLGYYWFDYLLDMQIEGTREAFMEMISQKGFAAKSGIDKALISLWKNGKRVPTLDKMEEVLHAHGASVVQEKVWDVNTKEEL